jgi:hypothetical protein
VRVTLPADLTGWNFRNVLRYAVNMAVLVVGFVLASRKLCERGRR